ncbi:MAG: SUMF1/EgtB/PvdO family nonheme iron enzyme [Deltaproteobacteria bacterium]|nr:SUMF1/EgtB/PvdO family nonheme iron enzyme [Deltaproteobacteria bacterium]
MDGLNSDNMPFTTLLGDHEIPAARQADLLWELLLESEAQGDEEGAAHYVAQLAAQNDERYVDLLEGTATLEIYSDPVGADATLKRLGVKDAPLLQLGPTPVHPFDLEPGDYLLEIKASGFVTACRHVRLGRAADLQVLVCLFTPQMLGADHFYLPAGRLPLPGGAPESDEQVFVDNLAVARQPVTVCEFLRFLDDLADEDPERAMLYTPPTMGAALAPSAPVTAISYDAAVDFTSWLARRTGVACRLPNEAEWQKAALAPVSKGLLQGKHEWATPMSAKTPSKPRGEALGFRLVHDLPPGGGERLLELQIPESLDAQVAA